MHVLPLTVAILCIISIALAQGGMSMGPQASPFTFLNLIGTFLSPLAQILNPIFKFLMPFIYPFLLIGRNILSALRIA